MPSMWTLGARSACYPRYLLSVERRPFLWAAGSLRPAFAPARPVHLSQAPACTLALSGRLPTVLGQQLRASALLFGEATAPNQTTRLARSGPDIRRRVGLTGTEAVFQGSSMRLAPRFRLPPAYPLRAEPTAIARSCSEGSRGLSVLPQVIRIFTNSAISPGPWSDSAQVVYAVRAGRNLPDKEISLP